MLLREAYDESTPDTPILMLITHSVEVLDAVKEFQQKMTNLSGGKKVDLKPFSIGKGIERKVADALETAAKNGDWVLVENIHLAPEWLPALEALVTETTKDPKINSGFRIFFSTIQMD
jgi:dynein heavy chain, axonemal